MRDEHSAEHAVGGAASGFWSTADGALADDCEAWWCARLAAPAAVRRVSIDFLSLSPFFGASGQAILPSDVCVDVSVDNGATCRLAAAASASARAFDAIDVPADVCADALATHVRLRLRSTAPWAIVSDVAASAERTTALAQLALDDEQLVAAIGSDTALASATRCATLPPLARALVRVAREAVQCYLPHALSKVCRVDYGVLSERDLAALGTSQTARRIATAVPFTGKDRPSPSAEFAHADVRLVRRFGTLDCGVPMSCRWSVDCKRSCVWNAAHRPCDRLRGCFASGRVLRIATWLNRPTCERTVGALCTMLARSDGARERHLREHVFPLCLRQHARHVSASGEQLGDTAVFGSCGTPSTLLRRVLL